MDESLIDITKQRDDLAHALQRLLDAPTLGSNAAIRRAREVAEQALSSCGKSDLNRYAHEAEAFKWGYEQLQASMVELGRHGWAHDYDSEIEGRKGMATFHPERTAAYAYEAAYEYLKDRFGNGLNRPDLACQFDAEVQCRTTAVAQVNRTAKQPRI